MSIFPPIPHVLLATHKTKANIFYFSFREATSLSPQHKSTGRHPVKKALTEGASPPSIAEERKRREDSEPRGPVPCPLFPQIQESRPIEIILLRYILIIYGGITFFSILNSPQGIAAGDDGFKAPTSFIY